MIAGIAAAAAAGLIVWWIPGPKSAASALGINHLPQCWDSRDTELATRECLRRHRFFAPRYGMVKPWRGSSRCILITAIDRPRSLWTVPARDFSISIEREDRRSTQPGDTASDATGRIPMLLHPRPRMFSCLASGTGMTAAAVARYPVKTTRRGGAGRSPAARFLMTIQTVTRDPRVHPHRRWSQSFSRTKKRP